MMHCHDMIPARAVYIPGPPRWYALTVQSQCEGKVGAWLHEQGVYSFHPVKRRTRLAKGREVTTESRYLPGYVFARFPGQPIRHRIASRCPWITGAVTVQSGAWAILRPHDLTALHRMRSLDTMQERQRRRESRRRNRIAPGDRVAILSGLWEDSEGHEVIELRGGQAIVRIQMLGADRLVEADIARVRKIG